MKNKILTIILFLSILGCTKQKKRIIYETKNNELLALELNEEKKEYKISWIIIGTQNELNYFGLIEFSYKIIKTENENIIFLPSKIVTNNIKSSDRKTVKAPISQDPNIEFNIEDNSLTFYKERLTPKEKYSYKKCIKLIESFEEWSGSKIDFDNLLKD